MPNKLLGQHWLIDKNILKNIIKISRINSQDTVLEIGTGTGNLTQYLSLAAKKVISIEKDPQIFKVSQNKLAKTNNLVLINQDILKIDIKSLGLNAYKVVGNIPYYLTGKLLRQIMENWPKPELIILMVQQEVAQRLTDQKKSSKISVFANLYGQVKIAKTVLAKAFFPKPKVNSCLITITPALNPPKELSQKSFQTLVKTGFSQPRKYLFSNLKSLYPFPVLNQAFIKLGLSLKARPETLAPLIWVELHQQLEQDYF